MTLQTTAADRPPRDPETLADMVWLSAEALRGADLPQRAELLAAVDELFAVVSLREDPLRSAHTCTIWRERLRARRAEAVAVAGEPVVRHHERRLEASTRLYERRVLTLLRLELARFA